MVPHQGAPVRAMPSAAARNSSGAEIVSTQSTSAPPASSPRACSSNISAAASTVSGPSGAMISPVGPIEPATTTGRPGGVGGLAGDLGGDAVELDARGPRRRAASAGWRCRRSCWSGRGRCRRRSRRRRARGPSPARSRSRARAPRRPRAPCRRGWCRSRRRPAASRARRAGSRARRHRVPSFRPAPARPGRWRGCAATMARSPFERCDDRCWSRSSRPSSASASTATTAAGCEPGVERVQHRDQPAHDHRVGIALEVEARRRPLALDPRHDPDLAGAALDLGRRHPQRVVERRHGAAELDDVAVAVLPVVEEGEVVGDLFEAGAGQGRGSDAVSRTM